MTNCLIFLNSTTCVGKELLDRILNIPLQNLQGQTNQHRDCQAEMEVIWTYLAFGCRNSIIPINAVLLPIHSKGELQTEVEIAPVL